MTATLKIKGLSELQKYLDQLPAKMEANIMRGALRAGLKPVAEAARNNVNHVSGDLARSVRITSRINKKEGKTVASVKAGATKRFPGPYYAHFVEYGTRAHFISVPENEKIVYRTRRGDTRTESMTTVNRRVLKIGSNFIGPTVRHPGAKPRPYMRPAMDTQASNAVVHAGEYIKKRLATKHGIDTKDIEISVDE